MNARAFFADEIEAVCGLSTPGLRDAFAAVPRERFLGPGPWIVRGEADLFGPPRTTPDADPRRVYHNVAIAIDPSRQLFNGGPAVLATWLDALKLKAGARVLHVGCGTGYYSAILGQVVGSDGLVEAVEVDPDLAARAAETLGEWPWIRVRQGDGAEHGGPFDAIVINAGATHPRQSWLDALAPGARMILPLTIAMTPGSTIGKGFVLLIARTDEGLSARFMNVVAIYNAHGVRDAALEQKLGQAMRRGDFGTVAVLRRDPHDEAPTCWFHDERMCLSRTI